MCQVEHNYDNEIHFNSQNIQNFMKGFSLLTIWFFWLWQKKSISKRTEENLVEIIVDVETENDVESKTKFAKEISNNCKVTELELKPKVLNDTGSVIHFKPWPSTINIDTQAIDLNPRPTILTIDNERKDKGLKSTVRKSLQNKENKKVLLSSQAIKRHISPNCRSDAEAVRFSQRRNELSDTLINTVIKIEPFEFHLQQNGRYLCSNRKVQFWQCHRPTFRGTFKVGI